MGEFKASNGATVSRDIVGGVKVTPPARALIWLPVLSTTALREFFQHDCDKELGRWRWPENPDYVVYRKPGADDVIIGRAVFVINERSGEGFWSWEQSVANGPLGPAERAFFEAHPEPKPWHDAEPGEVWVLTYDGTEGVFLHSGGSWYGQGNMRVVFDHPIRDTNVSAGRRIWPKQVDVPTG